MKIAITGGTGFVGRHLARALVASGHEPVLLARGADRRDLGVRSLSGARFVAAGLDDREELARAFEGCEAVAHLAGINRETGEQTYERVHVRGTRNVVEAAIRAGCARIALLSFVRARPDCGSPYHETKWAAEEIVRGSGLDFTVLKCGMIYGKGDHMIDHLSRAMRTAPVFASVGCRERSVRPVAVEDVARILIASLVEGRLVGRTVAVVGPETMPFSEAVRRVARTIGRRALIFPMPVFFHLLLARAAELTMKVPLLARAQARMLAEGIAEAWPPVDSLPPDLEPQTPLDERRIRAGLPDEGAFGLRDLRWFG